MLPGLSNMFPGDGRVTSTPAWNTLRLVDAVEQDDAGAKDVGTTDLGARCIGVTTTNSAGAGSRAALAYYWPVELPKNARTLALRLPVVTQGTPTNNHTLRFGLLDSTTQATSAGAVYDLSSNGTSDRIGVAPAWSALSTGAVGTLTPVFFRAESSLLFEKAGGEWVTTSHLLTGVDVDGESANTRQSTALDRLAALTDPDGVTAYICCIVHTVGGVANTFTLDADIQYRVIADT